MWGEPVREETVGSAVDRKKLSRRPNQPAARTVLIGGPPPSEPSWPLGTRRLRGHEVMPVARAYNTLLGTPAELEGLHFAKGARSAACCTRLLIEAAVRSGLRSQASMKRKESSRTDAPSLL